MSLFTFRQRLFFAFLLISAVLSYFFVDRLLLSLSFSPSIRFLLKLCTHAISPPLILLLAGGAFLIARFAKKWRHLTLHCFEIVTAQCLSVAFVRVSKVLIGRARPDIFMKKGVYGFYGFQVDHHFHSFPSGHTMGVLTLAVSLSLLYPRYCIPLYSIACALSFSRVLLADHYFSDILGTTCIAMIVGGATHIILNKITGSQRSPSYEKA